MEKYHFEKTDSIFYMDVAMVSEYLHVAKSTIYKWVEEDYIPHKKLKKRLLFIKNQIDEWVLNNGILVNDLPEVPQYREIENEKSESSHRLVTSKEQPSIQGNFTVKYRSAG
jgi:excisionase family DNA binding protein